MLAPLTPFALASSANSRFQASKPAAVLPHCAASAVAPRHANTANAARATINVLPWIIQTPFAPFGLGRLALRLLGGRFLAGLLACDRHQHFLLAACRLPGLLRRLRGLSRLGTANAPAQRLHQVHDIASSGTVLVRDRLAGALLEVDQRCFVLVLEFFRLEPSGLLVDDVFGQVEHVLGDFDVLDLVEIFALGANFVW